MFIPIDAVVVTLAVILPITTDAFHEVINSDVTLDGYINTIVLQSTGDTVKVGVTVALRARKLKKEATRQIFLAFVMHGFTTTHIPHARIKGIARRKYTERVLYWTNNVFLETTK